MTYITHDDHLALLSAESDHLNGGAALQGVYRRLLALHKSIAPRMHKHGIELYPVGEGPHAVMADSTAATHETAVLSVIYMRPRSSARVIEDIMGLDAMHRDSGIDPRRHPVIELRLTPHDFTIELVASPDAWYDQQNLIGKLRVEEHRNTLYQMLRDFDANYSLGFWAGLHLDEMHVGSQQMPPPRVLFQWLETLAAESDYFRVGAWYEPDDERLSEDHLAREVYHRVRELHQVYTFMAWSSNNDFSKFYRRSLVRSR